MIDELRERKEKKLIKELLHAQEIARLKINLLVTSFAAASSINYGSDYAVLIGKINTELDKLGILKEKLMRAEFESTYISTFAATGSFDLSLPKELVDKALNKEWAGRTFSKSVWNDTQVLKKTIAKHVDDIINTGVSKDKSVSEISKRFAVSMSRADALVRTETTYFITQAQVAKYTQSGFTQYRFLATNDNRTSSKCREHNGHTYDFNKSIVGVNLPPLHVGCRSTIVPVVD